MGVGSLVALTVFFSMELVSAGEGMVVVVVAGAFAGTEGRGTDGRTESRLGDVLLIYKEEKGEFWGLRCECITGILSFCA